MSRKWIVGMVLGISITGCAASPSACDLVDLKGACRLVMGASDGGEQGGVQQSGSPQASREGEPVRP